MMRIVVKIGTNIISNPNGTLDSKRIRSLVRGLVRWHRAGWQVVLVSSGAIGAGIGKLGWKRRPHSLRDKQAAAAVGQVQLMGMYNSLFGRCKVNIAQILLTREDLSAHARYLNTRNTLMALLQMGIIPVINENDTVSVDEIVFGDNDTLAALVAMKIEAQKLVILTDVDGIFERDPKKHQGQECIPVIDRITPEIERLCLPMAGSLASTGGMQSKVKAAAIALRAGIEVIIANGYRDATLRDIFAGRQAGTRFVPEARSLKLKKRWIAFGAKVSGKVVIDKGAVEAIRHHGKSLLPAGVAVVGGHFSQGDTISLVDADNREIARGISSFSSGDLDRIKGKKTSQITEILGRMDFSEVVHRANLVIL